MCFVQGQNECHQNRVGVHEAFSAHGSRIHFAFDFLLYRQTMSITDDTALALLVACLKKKMKTEREKNPDERVKAMNSRMNSY